MKQLDVYHDGRLVFGYEVHYNQNKDGFNKVFQVGHHIGGHLTGDVKCDSLVFEKDEYIVDIITSSGDVVDRLEFTTSLGRQFKAGGSGGSLSYT